MSSLPASHLDAHVETSLEILEEICAQYPARDFAVRFWSGYLWGETLHPRFTLVLKHPGSLRAMLLEATELSLGEAYIYDDFDVEGDLEAAFQFGDYLVAHELRLRQKVHLLTRLRRLPVPKRARAKSPHLVGSQHSRERDRVAVTYHYDLSNDFYALWLDRSMTYSCAYFPTGKEDIDTAQQQKLDYICRKLRLQPDETLLDIGCGWGGLILHAVKHFGVRALGITLSREQVMLARERIAAEGLLDRCKVEVRDYRDMTSEAQFDKIVSVGMFEHVGEARLPEYFRQAWTLLKSGGVFLNHGIAVSATFKRKGESFIDKYVFPDGELVPLDTTVRAGELSGFEVRDVESLREHYAKTLRLWVRRLEGHYQDTVRLTNETVYRIWRIYMAGSAHAFATGRVNLYQVLFSKPENGRSHLPLTRGDWYVAG